MAVNLSAPADSSLTSVPGVRIATARAQIRKWDRDDVTVFVFDAGSKAAGVFTRNRFCAAPVLVCREHLAAGGEIRALVINAGNANAGTGAAGIEAARRTCTEAARVLKCAPSAILPFSTGVIMEPLAVGRITAVLPDCVGRARPDAWPAAMRAIMTTDTVPKGASARASVGGIPVVVTGIAKGAGMIQPRMATMLSYVCTDARVDARLLARLAREAADLTFNRITIDGDTSTNDSFVVVATGAAPMPPIASAADPGYAELRSAVVDVSRRLALAIVRDGEGATKFMTIEVRGGRDDGECDRIARAIAHSPLVKTAFFASDPNLGRIVCAIGNGGSDDLDPGGVSFWLGDVLVVERGGRAASYREEDGQRVMKAPEINVTVELGRGAASATVWTCDFSHDYVSINADYRS